MWKIWKLKKLLIFSKKMVNVFKKNVGWNDSQLFFWCLKKRRSYRKKFLFDFFLAFIYEENFFFFFSTFLQNFSNFFFKTFFKLFVKCFFNLFFTFFSKCFLFFFVSEVCVCMCVRVCVRVCVCACGVWGSGGRVVWGCGGGMCILRECACLYVSLFVCVSAWACVCVSLCVRMSVFVCLCMCVPVYAHVCVCVPVYVCTYVCGGRLNVLSPILCCLCRPTTSGSVCWFLLCVRGCSSMPSSRKVDFGDPPPSPG